MWCRLSILYILSERSPLALSNNKMFSGEKKTHAKSKIAVTLSHRQSADFVPHFSTVFLVGRLKATILI